MTKAGWWWNMSVFYSWRRFWMKSTRQRSVTSPCGPQGEAGAAATPESGCRGSAWESTSAPPAAPCTPNPPEAPRTSPSASGWRRRRAPTCHRRPTSRRHTKTAWIKCRAKRRRNRGLGRGGKGKRGRGGHALWGGGWRMNWVADSSWSGGLCSASRGRCIKTPSVSDEGESKQLTWFSEHVCAALKPQILQSALTLCCVSVVELRWWWCLKNRADS